MRHFFTPLGGHSSQGAQRYQMLAPANQVNDSADVNYLLDPLRLCFKSSAVEQRFQEESISEALNIIRIYLTAACALYMAFGLLDVITDDPSLHTLLFIRFGIVCPILLASCASTFHPAFPKYSQAILAFAMISPGVGVIAMTSIMAPPFNSLYYAGLIMVVMYGSCLVRLQYMYAFLVTLFLFIAYQISAVYLNHLPIKMFLSNNFFLLMASAVGLFSGYLQELYLRKTYTGQKIIEAKNEQANLLLLEAQKANKSKSDFLANMSHELRTPLNAIIGFSDIISKELLGPVGNAKYSEYSLDINNSGAHLLSIINDILDLAKAESGKLSLLEEDVSMQYCVEECLRTCRPAAEIGKVQLLNGTPSLDFIIRGDRRLLFQILLNLISNAVKFTPEGGRVELSVSANEEGGAFVSVKDTGIGIPPDNIDRVMRPFEQVENTYARRHGGTGLGLPYSAKLAELHDGKIQLSSELHRGTVATLWLPPSRLVKISRPLKAVG